VCRCVAWRVSRGASRGLGGELVERAVCAFYRKLREPPGEVNIAQAAGISAVLKRESEPTSAKAGTSIPMPTQTKNNHVGKAVKIAGNGVQAW